MHGRKGLQSLPQKKHAGLKPLSLKDSLVLIKQEHADYLLVRTFLQALFNCYRKRKQKK